VSPSSQDENDFEPEKKLIFGEERDNQRTFHVRMTSISKFGSKYQSKA
jgi:hypothetical protein